MTICLAIPHTPWIPERVTTLANLTKTIAAHAPFRLFTEREPNWSWSPKLWKWGVQTGCDYLLQLQDDTIVDPEFWAKLDKLIEAVPDQIIGLQTAHPVSRYLYQRGDSWCTTSDGLIGVGYLLPRKILMNFLEWRDTLHATAVKAITEDTLIDVYCLVTGRKVWHPIPTIIDHDVSIPSTYGNDGHALRRPEVSTLKGDKASSWKLDGPPAHLGHFYGGTTHRLAQQWIEGFVQRDEPDDLRAIFGERMVQGLPVELCALCARFKPHVRGPTGLMVCASCVGNGCNALLHGFFQGQ
jgi:hypothetical protein